jgi:glycosyltransferase involved in cell wall biosynthesis
VHSFTFGLIDGFLAVESRHEFVLIVTRSNRGMFTKYEDRRGIRIFELNENGYPLIRRYYESLHWKVRASQAVTRALNRVLSTAGRRILDAEADVQYAPYCPSPLFPYSKKPSIYSIHDLQHVHHPEFFTTEQLAERRLVFSQCIGNATLIQASSEYMGRDFLEHFPQLTRSQVVVIPEGVDFDEFSRPRSLADLKMKYRLPDQYLLYPAQLWHHKNHMTVLRALARLNANGEVVPLVLTGARYQAADQIFKFIDENGLSGQVAHLGVVPFDELVALYQHASLLVMPSLFESNSMPILESAAAGTPIVASRIPPNEELAKHLHMRLFSPTDDVELATVLMEALQQRAVEAAKIDENRAVVRHYSWENAARGYLAAFEAIADRRGIPRELTVDRTAVSYAKGR